MFRVDTTSPERTHRVESRPHEPLVVKASHQKTSRALRELNEVLVDLASPVPNERIDPYHEPTVTEPRTDPSTLEPPTLSTGRADKPSSRAVPPARGRHTMDEDARATKKGRVTSRSRWGRG